MPMRVMNMCISFSMRFAARWTSSSGYTAAEPARMRGSVISKVMPANPEKSAPSVKPPSRK